MSDEQPVNNENHIDLVGSKVDMVAAKLDQLISGPVQTLLTGVGILTTDVGTLKTDVGALKTDVGALKTGQESLARQMRTLHEDTKREIRLVAEVQAAHREETADGFVAARKELAAGLAPLSDAVRHHTAVLKEMRNGPKPRA